MKKLLLITLALSGFLMSGQCKTTKTFDKFENATQYQSEVESFIKKGNGFQTYITKYCKGSECIYTIVIFNAMDECRTDKSYIEFLNDKGGKMHIDYVSEIECGKGFAKFFLTETQIKQLEENTITDIKLVYENYLTVSLDEKLRKKLKDLLRCIIEAK